MYNLIQIALLGKTPIVVEHGLRRTIPTKLYIIHSKNEADYEYEFKADELKEKIQTEYHIPIQLLKVNAYDMDQIIKTILNTIINEKDNT